MGRARRQVRAVAVNRVDAFAATFGSLRGNSAVNALVSGQTNALADTAAGHLIEQQRVGRFQESLEILYRDFASTDTDVPSSKPLLKVATALFEVALERALEAWHWQQQTIKLLSDLGLRSKYCQYLICDQLAKPIGDVSFPSGEDAFTRTLHFTVLSDRQHQVGTDWKLVCGRTLAASASWAPATRGDWHLARSRRLTHCPDCALHADKFEESREDWPYEPLSETQLPLILDGAMQEMRSRFRGALDIAGCSATTLNSLALHSYRKALGDLIAHELHTAGEWPFRDAILSGEDYAHYLELASHPAVTREGLAGILSERDWRELGSALVSDALPITPPATTTIRGPMSAQRRLCDALGDVISGRRYIAL